MTVDRYTLDTNILFYAVNRQADIKHSIAANLIIKSATKDCILTLQSLTEFFHATTRKKLLSVQDAEAQVGDWMTIFPIQSANPATAVKAMQGVQVHGFSFWDAMIWSCAKEAGCSHIITEDFQHGQIVEGVRFDNPFKSAAIN